MPYKFVYGAQMTHKWSLRHGQLASVENYRIRFNHVGFGSLEPTFANLDVAQDDKAWGVLVEFPDHLWEEILHNEPSYDEIDIEVITQDGESFSCQALTLKPTRIGNDKNPSARYARLLYQGAKLHQFPNEVVNHYKELYKTGNNLTLWLGPLKQPLFALAKTMIARKNRKQEK